MNPRAQRDAIRRHLNTAREALVAGDRGGAQRAVEAALALDPEYLAARSLLEQIDSQTEPGLGASFSRRRLDTPTPSTPTAASTEQDGWTRFESRARSRRIDRRADAARAAITGGDLDLAREAMAEIREIDPAHPELLVLQFELDAARHEPRRSFAGPLAAGLFAFAVLFAGVTGIPRAPHPEPARAVAPHLASGNGRAVNREGSELRGTDGAETSVVGGVAATPGTGVPEPTANIGTDEATAAASAARVGSTGERGTAGRMEQPQASRSVDVRPEIDRRVGLRSVSGAAIENRAPAESEPAAGDRRTAQTPQPLPSPQTAAQSGQAVVGAGVSRPAADSVAAPPPPTAPPVVPSSEPSASAALVSPPSAPLPTPVTAAPAAVATPGDDELARRALQQYRRGYDALDARAVQQVWPSVDGPALQRAFAGLQSQRLVFDDCRIDLRGAAATAVCRGTARYVPKVGSRDPREDPRVWTFSLRKSDDRWFIDAARADR